MNEELKVALIAEKNDLENPETIGLAQEQLYEQHWLKTFSSGAETRRYLRANNSIEEVWVYSCNDLAPINLAASLKRDYPARKVCLLSKQQTGSLKSRANAAGIDASFTRQAFVKRYHTVKNRLNFVYAPRPEKTPYEAATFPYMRDLKQSVSRAFLLPVVSGSGGSGKSTVSVLSALWAQQHGYNTLLLDFDLQFGDAQHLMGVKNYVSLDDFAAGMVHLPQLKEEKSLPALLAAPRRLEESESLIKKMPVLLDELLSSFDVVVANTGAAWAEQHAVLLERANKVLFLVDQRPSSFRACKHALDLCSRCGIAMGHFLYVLNKCKKNAMFTSIDASCALEGLNVSELRDGGRDVEDLLAMGLPGELMKSRNELCISLEVLLRDVFPEAASESRERSASSESISFTLFNRRKPSRRVRGAACL